MVRQLGCSRAEVLLACWKQTTYPYIYLLTLVSLADFLLDLIKLNDQIEMCKEMGLTMWVMAVSCQTISGGRVLSR
jgi:hypothetical protein